MDYKYSIIIPHYNSTKLLNNLIESIPSRNDIEIIIVDDNSDVPLELSFIYNENISLYINDSGIKGAGACRNIGLKKAIGKWLLFADADDYFLPKAFDIIDNKVNDWVELLYFTPTSKCLLTGDISDRHLGFKNLVDCFLNYGDESIRYRCVVPWSKVYRHDFIIANNIVFDEVIASNDVMFSVRSGHLAKRIQVFKDVIYCVTKGKNSLTTNKSKKIIKSRLLVELGRYKYFYSYNINITKSSFLHFIMQYIRAIDLDTLLLLYSCYKSGIITIFPSTYIYYLRSPSAFFLRVFTKLSANIRDKNNKES